MTSRSKFKITVEKPLSNTRRNENDEHEDPISVQNSINHGGEQRTGRWSRSERCNFINGKVVHIVGLKEYGKEWKKLAKCVPTRTLTQIKTHAQKFLIRLKRSTPRGMDPLEHFGRMSKKALVPFIKDSSDSNPEALESESPSSFEYTAKVTKKLKVK